MKDRLQDALAKAVRQLLTDAGDVGDPPAFALDVPRSPEHGDFACNAALLLAKRLRCPPRAAAERLLAAVGDAGGLVARAEVAGPGFLNLWLTGERWHDLLREILRAGAAFGRSQAGHGAARAGGVRVRQPDGARSRSATAGRRCSATCIARLLEATGWAVTREYYFNDGGRQMRVLGESVKARYLEQLGRAAPPPADAARRRRAPSGRRRSAPCRSRSRRAATRATTSARSPPRCARSTARRWSTSPATGSSARWRRSGSSRRSTRRSTSLGVRFDVYYNETSLYETGKIEATLADAAREGARLRRRRRGLAAGHGARARPRPRAREEHAASRPTCCPDIAYHREKFRRGFERVIDVQGADHIEQFPFVRAAAAALGCDPAAARARDAPVRDAHAGRAAGEAVDQARDLRHRRRRSWRKSAQTCSASS